MPELIRTLTHVIQLDSALRRRLKMALFGPELSVNPQPCNAQGGKIIPLGSTGGQGQWEKPSSFLSVLEFLRVHVEEAAETPQMTPGTTCKFP